MDALGPTFTGSWPNTFEFFCGSFSNGLKFSAVDAPNDFYFIKGPSDGFCGSALIGALAELVFAVPLEKVTYDPCLGAPKTDWFCLAGSVGFAGSTALLG